MDFFMAEKPDMLCLQEIKMEEGQAEVITEGYHQYWHSAEKKGYSGTLIFSKEEPLSVRFGMGIEEHDREGRVITAEYEDFFLVNVYTPNSKDQLQRLEYRMLWEDVFRGYLKGLEKSKPVIVCGDMNVAHKEIDLKNPKANRRKPVLPMRTLKISDLLDAGGVDTFSIFIRKWKTPYQGGAPVQCQTQQCMMRIEFPGAEALTPRLKARRLKRCFWVSDIALVVELES